MNTMTSVQRYGLQLGPRTRSFIRFVATFVNPVVMLIAGSGGGCGPEARAGVMAVGSASGNSNVAVRSRQPRIWDLIWSPRATTQINHRRLIAQLSTKTSVGL